MATPIPDDPERQGQQDRRVAVVQPSQCLPVTAHDGAHELDVLVVRRRGYTPLAPGHGSHTSTFREAHAKHAPGTSEPRDRLPSGLAPATERDRVCAQSSRSRGLTGCGPRGGRAATGGSPSTRTRR